MKRTEKNTQWHMRVILLLAGDIIAIMLSSFREYETFSVNNVLEGLLW